MAFRDCIVTARDGGELTREDADRLLRRLDELTASGLSAEDAKQRLISESEADAVGKAIRAWEGHLDRGLQPEEAKAKILAGLSGSREIRDQVIARLDATVVLTEPPRGLLTPDQERHFAEAFPTLATKYERIAVLHQLTGDTSIGEGRLKKLQRDLAERGLIELGVGKAVAPTPRVEPEFAIPRLMKKKTRAAGKPMAGVFEANPNLVWTGLPEGEFRANLRHIAEKRARKDDPAIYGDLTTPEKVEAHIGEVLASPTFAQVRMLDGKPHELVLVRLGAEGLDQVVGVAVHKGDGTGRLYITTAFNQRRADTERRLAAALDQGGARALKMQQTPAGLNEIRSLIEAAPTNLRGPAWEEINASLSREQAATRKPSIDPSDMGMRLEARKAILDGSTVYVAPAVRADVSRVLDDLMDVVPEDVRVGVLEKLEPATGPLTPEDIDKLVNQLGLRAARKALARGPGGRVGRRRGRPCPIRHRRSQDRSGSPSHPG